MHKSGAARGMTYGCPHVSTGAMHLLPRPVTVDLVSTRLQHEFVAAEHVIHVRQNLAECETGLMFVERPLKDMRHELRHRERLLLACVSDGNATLRVMFEQIGDALVQAVEG